MMCVHVAMPVRIINKSIHRTKYTEELVSIVGLDGFCLSLSFSTKETRDETNVPASLPLSGVNRVSPLVSHTAYFSVCVCEAGRVCVCVMKNEQGENDVQVCQVCFGNEKVECFEFAAASEAKTTTCNFPRWGSGYIVI